MTDNTDLLSDPDSAIADLLARVRVSTGREKGALLAHLGRALSNIGAFYSARTALSQAMSLAPDHADVRWSNGMMRFGDGAWEDGLALYEARWDLSHFQRYHRAFPHPVWAGQPITDKRLLLWAEQGIGDQIMQARALAPLQANGAQITVECDPRLHPLIGRSVPGIACAAQTVALPAELTRGTFDHQGPLFSAWRWAGLERSPRSYLVPDPALVANFRAAWARQGWTRNVGISWRSRSKLADGARRSLPEPLLKPLITQPGITWHNLQYDADAGELADLSRHFGQPIWLDAGTDPMADIDRLAAQIAALDLVVTIDNVTAHLAGAVGTPCWVVLPAGSEWRWGHAMTTTPLYDSLRLFRNRNTAQWGGVLAEVCGALERWINTP